jgi:hypothetical protein
MQGQWWWGSAGRADAGEGRGVVPVQPFLLSFNVFNLEKKNMDSSEEENKYLDISVKLILADLTYGSNLVPH